MTDDSLSVEFESRLSRAERRRLGVFNTPLDVARRAVEALIDRPGTVCDPSCGTGTFLLAAVERLRALGVSRPEVVGVDVDPSAVAVAQARVPEASVRVGDGLALPSSARFDYVVGNPPFVDRLQARFVEHATRLADAVAMIVPTSLLATDDGRAARSAGLGVVSCERLGPVFDAEVDTCLLVLRRGAPVPAGPTWSSLLVASSDLPAVTLSGPTLGSSCTVVAGFRQHYYGLRGHVREGGPSPLRLVTSGRIGVGALVEDRPVRFDGVRYCDPRVSLDAVDEPVRSWFGALLRPKVVVATQTRVIEAAVDADGSMVPSVPVISVVPTGIEGVPASVWHVLAVLLAPPVTAWAIRRWGGTALTPSALKLGAPHVREIPVPSGSGAAASWDAAATLLGEGAVVEAGRLMCAAYGAGEEVHEWWVARLR